MSIVLALAIERAGERLRKRVLPNRSHLAKALGALLRKCRDAPLRA